MAAVVVIAQYQLETIYGIALLVIALAALYLAKWSVRGMMTYVATCAVLFYCCGRARDVINSIREPRGYTVSVPVITTLPPPGETVDSDGDGEIDEIGPI